jgi:hypothetical protein
MYCHHSLSSHHHRAEAGIQNGDSSSKRRKTPSYSRGCGLAATIFSMLEDMRKVRLVARCNGDVRGLHLQAVVSTRGYTIK